MVYFWARPSSRFDSSISDLHLMANGATNSSLSMVLSRSAMMRMKKAAISVNQGSLVKKQKLLQRLRALQDVRNLKFRAKASWLRSRKRSRHRRDATGMWPWHQLISILAITKNKSKRSGSSQQLSRIQGNQLASSLTDVVQMQV